MEKQLEIPTIQKNNDTRSQQVAQSSCCSAPSTGSACCTPSTSAEDNGGACCAQPVDGSTCCDK